MVNLATVKIWGKEVGVVSWDKQTGGVFEFYPEFLKENLDLSPIHMPLSHLKNAGSLIFQFRNLNEETYHGLPGLLADSIPDRYGQELINAYLQKQGRAPGSMNPVEKLCYVGKRGMGALEFEPAQHNGLNQSEEVHIDELVAIARKVLKQRDQLTTNLEEGSENGLMDIIRVGTSAGGARAKAVIAYHEQTHEVRSGQVAAPEGFNYWLIKFDGVNDNALHVPQGFGRIEYTYYQMALECGIQMAECRLLEENGRAHFMTKRFDRETGGAKLHMSTLCGMAHFDYNQPSLYSYEQAFQVMRTIRLKFQDAEQMFRRMVFNVVARNQDDHTKNISFLMDKKGNWRLSPAYDITFSYDPESFWVSRHQMSVNGKRDDFVKGDLIKVGQDMNIKKREEIIDQTIQKVGDLWLEKARKNGVDESHIQSIHKAHRLKL